MSIQSINKKINSLQKLYFTFWITSIIVFLIGFPYRNNPEEIINITIYDTYYAIEIFQLMTFLALFYFLVGFGYWLVKKVNGRLNRLLSYLHAFIMFGSLLLNLIVWISTTQNSQLRNTTLVISLLTVLFIAQPLYVINLMLGIFNWNKDRKIKL